MLNQKELSKIDSAEKVPSLGTGEGIPLKKCSSRWKRGGLMVRIIVKGKNS